MLKINMFNDFACSNKFMQMKFDAIDRFNLLMGKVMNDLLGIKIVNDKYTIGF
ncbi:hypothetical protein D9M68_712800 [compost metagenome]